MDDLDLSQVAEKVIKSGEVAEDLVKTLGQETVERRLRSYGFKLVPRPSGGTYLVRPYTQP